VGYLFFVSGLGLIDLISAEYWTAEGGKIGWLISAPLLSMFGYYASAIILIAILIISCLILFETRITIESIFFWRKNKEIEDTDDDEENEKDEEEKIDEIAEKAVEKEEKERENEEKDNKKQSKGIFVKNNNEEESYIKYNPKAVGNTKYVPPPLSLLENDKGKIVSGDIKANANIIKRTLQNFGIDVEMDEVSIGPSVTRYALKPAEGVKFQE
jgi:S-DNA-T family DNA segregation ATPase FtsK/SpoIIIE